MFHELENGLEITCYYIPTQMDYISLRYNISSHNISVSISEYSSVNNGMVRYENASQ